jgi:predicted nucleic acid-binding protein
LSIPAALRSTTVLRVLVTDSSVIINFHHTSHLNFLGRLPNLRFAVPDEVVSEITDPLQAEILERLIVEGTLERVSVSGTSELSAFADFSSRLGLGESACLAIAQSRGWLVACDEKRIFLREASSCLGADRVVNTPGIYLLCIRAGVLSVEEADTAKGVLELHRYKMAFSSFRDLV